MKVSIIVPVYNSERYLSKCLNSIQLSTYKNIEVIVVNDGSTDGSLDIIEKFVNNDIRFNVISKTNNGLSEARRSGLKIATGDYVWFVDSDDWIDSEALVKCKDLLNGNNDIVMFGYYKAYTNRTEADHLFNENKIFEGDEKDNLTRRLIGPVKDEMRKPYKIDEYNTVWNKIYKRSLIQKIDLTEMKTTLAEDLWTNLQAFYFSNNIAYINELLYYYNRSNIGSLTAMYRCDNLECSRKLFLGFQSFISNISKHRSKCDYREALNNRMILSLFGIVRNIANSSLKAKEKTRVLKDYLVHSDYMRNFDQFEYKYLSIGWRLFYKLCELKKYSQIIVYEKMMEFVRNIYLKI